MRFLSGTKLSLGNRTCGSLFLIHENMKVLQKTPWQVERSIIHADLPTDIAVQTLEYLAICRAEAADKAIQVQGLSARSKEAAVLRNRIGAVSVGLRTDGLDETVSFYTLSAHDRDEIVSAIAYCNPTVETCPKLGGVYVNLPLETSERSFGKFGMQISESTSLTQYATRSKADGPLNREPSCLIQVELPKEADKIDALMRHLYEQSEQRVVLLVHYSGCRAKGWKAL